MPGWHLRRWHKCQAGTCDVGTCARIKRRSLIRRPPRPPSPPASQRRRAIERARARAASSDPPPVSRRLDITRFIGDYGGQLLGREDGEAVCNSLPEEATGFAFHFVHRGQMLWRDATRETSGELSTARDATRNAPIRFLYDFSGLISTDNFRVTN